ncbi:uncharacterized protein [Triticum aestivum]|uniref:uncharacterized protein isoform X1 n=1 Tax=Triticum aestivum TaxID=4565 RepID=UPI001D006AF8|nr:uncharacterized protein LOC123092028 isoform X1 [Triticum aestivum]XP_044369612.1 uncharacterized protein LOC123092028 isoform X1 [Triticum aestivum]
MTERTSVQKNMQEVWEPNNWRFKDCRGASSRVWFHIMQVQLYNPPPPRDPTRRRSSDSAPRLCLQFFCRHQCISTLAIHSSNHKDHHGRRRAYSSYGFSQVFQKCTILLCMLHSLSWEVILVLMNVKLTLCCCKATVQLKAPPPREPPRRSQGRLGRRNPSRRPGSPPPPSPRRRRRMPAGKALTGGRRRRGPRSCARALLLGALERRERAVARWAAVCSRGGRDGVDCVRGGAAMAAAGR